MSFANSNKEPVMKDSRRYCDSGRINCPHLPECGHECHYDSADVVRKIKPYPVVPEDIRVEGDGWHKVGAFMLASVMAVLAIICLALFFTGVWVWSLLL